MIRKFLLELPENIHLDWKVHSALRGFSMKDYVIFALQRQIEQDKDTLGKQPPKEEKE